MGFFDKLKAKAEKAMDKAVDQAVDKAQDSAEAKAKEKIKNEAVKQVMDIVLRRLLKDSSWSQVAENKLKDAIAEKATVMVKEEVENYTKGQHEELTDMIIESVMDEVVDEAFKQIKQELN